MFGPSPSAHAAHKDYTHCTGCGLCLLVCPLWRRTHDLGLSPLGRAKALQYGAHATDIAVSVASCTLCAACEPACPEDIDLVGMTLNLRRHLVQPAMMASLLARMESRPSRPGAPLPAARSALLAGEALRAQPRRLERVAALLGGGAALRVHDDDGADLVQALIEGVSIPPPRRERFLAPLRRLDEIVVADGLLFYHLRRWLPGAKLTSLGVALGRLPAIRRGLRAGDLYVIEARAYHADYQRLVKHYDELRRACGCSFNLDLQRIAIPATAAGSHASIEPDDGSSQVRWILQGRNVTRIVLEHLDDGAAFAQICDLPVVQLVDLADDGSS